MRLPAPPSNYSVSFGRQDVRLSTSSHLDIQAHLPLLFLSRLENDDSIPKVDRHSGIQLIRISSLRSRDSSKLSQILRSNSHQALTRDPVRHNIMTSQFHGFLNLDSTIKHSSWTLSNDKAQTSAFQLIAGNGLHTCYVITPPTHWRCSMISNMLLCRFNDKAHNQLNTHILYESSHKRFSWLLPHVTVLRSHFFIVDF